MRKQLLKWMSLGSIALAVLLFAVERAAADDDDPPSRVARLAYTNGNISFNPAGTDDWVAAVVNRPMTTGDKLWSDDRSRAELHLDTAVIRLSDHTGFSFLNLSDEITQLRLTEGTLYIRVRRLGDDETFEVDTPNLAFSILRPGRYRINVNEAGDKGVFDKVGRPIGETRWGDKVGKQRWPTKMADEVSDKVSVGGERPLTLATRRACAP